MVPARSLVIHHLVHREPAAVHEAMNTSPTEAHHPTSTGISNLILIALEVLNKSISSADAMSEAFLN